MSVDAPTEERIQCLKLFNSQVLTFLNHQIKQFLLEQWKVKLRGFYRNAISSSSTLEGDTQMKWTTPGYQWGHLLPCRSKRTQCLSTSLLIPTLFFFLLVLYFVLSIAGAMFVLSEWCFILFLVNQYDKAHHKNCLDS